MSNPNETTASAPVEGLREQLAIEIYDLSHNDAFNKRPENSKKYWLNIADKIIAMVQSKILPTPSEKPASPALDLGPIEARAAAATPGPWIAGYWSGRCSENHAHGKGDCHYKYHIDVSNEYWRSHVAGREPMMIIPGGESGPLISEATAQFIAHSREDIDKLVNEIKRLRGERQQGSEA